MSKPDKPPKDKPPKVKPMITVFRADNVNVVWGGAHTTPTQGGRPAWEFSSTNGQFEFNALGTDLTVSIFGAGDTLTVTIDGGTPFTITPAASWNNVSLFSGLTDTVHSVKVKQAVTNGSYIELANAFSLTGAAPALSLPTNSSNNIYNVGANVGIQSDGSVAAPSTQNGNPTAYTGFDYTLRFRATVTRIKVWMLDNANKFSLAIDGVDVNPAATNTPNSTVYNWVEIASGLDGNNEHEYQIAFTSINAATTALLMTVGGTLNGASLPALPTWGFYGNSIWRGIIAGTSDSATASPHQIALAKRWGNRNLGIGGTLVKGTGNSGESATRIATIPTTLTGMVVLYGFNDAAQVGGAETDVQFRASYDNMLTQLRARIGAGKLIYCLGILPTTFSPAGGNRTAFNVQIAASVAAQADAFIIYVPTDGWIVPADTTDLTHPTPAGYIKVTLAFLAAIADPRGPAGHAYAALANFRRRR